MTSLASSIRISFVTRSVSRPSSRTALVHTQNTCRIHFRTVTTPTNSQKDVRNEAPNEDKPETVMKTLEEQTTSTEKPPNFSVWNKLPPEVRQWSLVAIERSNGMFSSVITAMQTNLAIIGGKLNEVTGYERIEGLKQRVHEQGKRPIPRSSIKVLIKLSEQRLQTARQATREAKIAYEAAVQTRATSQRDLTDLLQRKSTWSSEDVSRFTSLVQQDHLNTLAESSSKTASQAADEALEREFGALTQIILERYHEEQVWSDKIRSASTYGSMIVLGVNVFVFLSAIVIVEPWKRKKLAEALGRRVEELAVETRGMVGIMQTHLDQQEQLLKDLMAKEAVVVDARTFKPEVNAPVPAISTSVPLKDIPVTAIEGFLHGRQKEIQAALVGALAGTALCFVVFLEFR